MEFKFGSLVILIILNFQFHRNQSHENPVVSVFLRNTAESTPMKRTPGNNFCNRELIYQYISAIKRQTQFPIGQCYRFNCEQQTTDTVIRGLCEARDLGYDSQDWCTMLILSMTQLSGHYYRNRNPDIDDRPFATFLQLDDLICPTYNAPVYVSTTASLQTLFCFAIFAIAKECEF
ncbi:uncharacterized protein [Apostichopus japonicus]|uniref:uncharacterized protein n=1 Tax=Stichopus japonicus TaxID=307972 RepID=UPI003AB31BEE